MAPTLTFPKGGVHPPEAKTLTEHLPIEVMPLPDELEIILGQHIGAPCRAVVSKRAEVAEGDLLGEVRQGLGVPIHAPAAGNIKAVGKSGHPVRVRAPSVTIAVDQKTPRKQWPNRDWQDDSPRQLLKRVHDAGIIGIGGAGFPSHVKLKPPSDNPVDTLLLNGAECEPYLTADHRVMLEMAAEIVTGAKIILKILGLTSCVIGIENNKLDAIKMMTDAANEAAGDGGTITVQPLAVKYPQGSEKQLIQSITGRKVPALALPSSVGVVVHNVSTSKAIYDAVVREKPLIERVVTISGMGIKRPANLLVKVGTKISDIVEFCGGITPELCRVVMGGPMMGFAVSELSIPLAKTTSSVLFLSAAEIDTDPHGACIRCGWCLDACPMGLEPKEIGVYVEANRAEDTADFGVFECFECGSCAYVCPAKRPLVQFVRLAKMKAKRSSLS